MHFSCLFVLLFVFLSLNLIVPLTSTSISLSNNAYSNIVVAISPDVPNTSAETILDNVKVKPN